MIYWFRSDLRLLDNPAFSRACAGAPWLLPVYVHAHDESRWGFPRVSAHRRAALAAALTGLSLRLRARGSGLLQLTGRPGELLPRLARSVGAAAVACEAIAAPEEEAEVAALRAAGLAVEPVWQSSLLEPAALPFAVERLPDVFTAFRQAVEKAGVRARAPEGEPSVLPGLPALDWAQWGHPWVVSPEGSVEHPGMVSPEGSAGLRHLAQYFGRKLAHTYKATRNGLTGPDFSSRFSPWLATGALSARTIGAALEQFEREHGANEGTDWLRFELLWRDYFRFLHLKYGKKLYRARGLSEAPPPKHDAAAFDRWRRGETGEPFVDAGMRELAATGWLSNRMRQVVASSLVHELGGDFRAGAAWFESQLIDYDVYSNQGNWLYIAGRGTDPRGGRKMNPQKQAREHDPDGSYRALWAGAGVAGERGPR